MKLPPAEEIERQVLAMPIVREGCERVGQMVEAEATGLADARAFDLGTYAAKIRRIPTEGPGVIVRAGDRVSAWIERGTGIYGPRKTPIRPKKGKYLVFRVKSGAPSASMSGKQSSSGLVFAREVKGRPASWVMRDASRTVADRLGLRWRDLTR